MEDDDQLESFFSDDSFDETESDDDSDGEEFNYVQKFKWGKGYKVFGLKNHGNTCYVNAGMQVLMRCPTFVKTIWKYYSYNRKRVIKENIKLVELLGDVLFKKGKNGRSRRMKRLLKYFVRLGVGAERIGQQHDSYALMGGLLDKLYEQGVELQGFGWGHKTFLHCPECKLFRSEEEDDDDEPDLDYFNIMTTNFKSVQEKVKKLTGLPIQGSECPRCKDSVSYQCDMLIETPKVGLIRFDRETDGEMVVNRSLTIPKMENGGNVRQKCKYVLVGVVIHKGVDLDDGHYTAAVRIDEDEWYDINDSVVKKVKWSKIQKKLGEDGKGKHGRCMVACYRKVDETFDEDTKDLRVFYKKVEMTKVVELINVERVKFNKVVEDMGKLKREYETKLEVVVEECKSYLSDLNMYKESEKKLEKENKELERKYVELVERYNGLVKKRKALKKKLAEMSKNAADQTIRKKELEITYSSIKRKEKIGEGASGKVYSGKWKNEGGDIVIAIKKIKLREGSNFLDHLNEFMLVVKCHHPLVMNVYGYSFSPDKKTMLIIMEKLDCDLHKYIKKKFKYLSLLEKCDLMRKITQCIHYLHEKAQVCHRDIKSLNFLLNKDASRICVADFGLSKAFENLSEGYLNTKRGAGTPRWMGPELMRSQPKFSTKTDVYALGMTFYEILNGICPFEKELGSGRVNPNSIGTVVLNEKMRPKFNNDVPIEYRKLVEGCWCHEPDRRFSTREILEEIKKLKRKEEGKVRYPERTEMDVV